MVEIDNSEPSAAGDKSTLAPRRKRDFVTSAGVVIVAIAARVFLWAVYDGPVRFPDTETYESMAQQIRSFDLSRYEGWRTPVYPMFLLALGGDPALIWFAQAALGVGTTVLLYLFVGRATDSRPAGAIVGLFHALALNQLLFEAAIVTEALTTFLLVLTLFLAQRTKDTRWPLRRSVGIGALGGIVTLTRPLYAVVGPVIAVSIVLTRKVGSLRSAAILSSVFIAGVLAWCLFNKATVGYFGITTLAGYNLTNHSGALMEKAPDRFADIRDIYVKHREERIKAGMTHRMAIFGARDDLKSATGLSDVELSRQFSGVSMWLFLHYPTDYAKSVGAAWLSFWAVPTPAIELRYSSPQVARAFGVISTVERWLFRGAYVAFLLLSLPTLWKAWVRERGGSPGWNSAAVLVSTVLAASALQALVEYGENPRYGVPTQSLAVAALFISLFLFVQPSSAKMTRSVSVR